MRVENILQNYDEFAALQALQAVDLNDPIAMEKFKQVHYVNDEQIAEMLKVPTLPVRAEQDYRSTYNDIRDWLRQRKEGNDKDNSPINWDDVVFEVDLLKSQEINLDYILALIFEHHKKKPRQRGVN